MPSIHVERSLSINVPHSRLHEILVDFEQWPIWSPWLCAEKSTQLLYRGDTGEVGHGYDWTGDVVGSGGMTLLDNDRHTLKMDLKFLKPFKSFAKVQFNLQEQSPDSTSVSWSMDSSLPFFLFFMAPMMKSMIGNDYKRGLLMLREYAETGVVNCDIEVIGVVDAPAISFLGTSTNSTMDELGNSMAEILPALHQHVADSSVDMTGPPLSVYNKMDIKTGACDYTAAVPIDANSEASKAAATGKYSLGDVEAGPTFKLVHKGDYQHLGNAWSTAYAHLRAKKIKICKKRKAYEIYLSDPATTATAELLTEIHVPLR